MICCNLPTVSLLVTLDLPLSTAGFRGFCSDHSPLVMAHTLRSYRSGGVMLPLLEFSWITSQLRNPVTGHGVVTMSVACLVHLVSLMQPH